MIDRALIQIFVCLYLVAILVTHADQQKPPLPAVYSNLPNDLVEALIEQLLPHRTKPNFSSLPRQQSFFELLVQLNDLDLGRGGREHRLHPQLPIIRPQFLGRQDLPEYVLGVMLLVFFFGLGGVGGLG